MGVIQVCAWALALPRTTAAACGLRQVTELLPVVVFPRKLP